MGLLRLLYYCGYKAHKWRGGRKAEALPAKVISVGNLTAGGTGKTPFVIALARELKREGMNPCVLTRGYGGKLKEPILVTPGLTYEAAGDEALLLAGKLGDLDGTGAIIPVVMGRNRHEAGLYALRKLSPPPELFILDDGFQHWGLKRDLDILLLSAQNPFGFEKLLPVGTLREPLRQMKRADMIVVSRCRAVPPGIEKTVRDYNTHAPVFASWHEPDDVVDFETGQRYPATCLQDREVYAFSGIEEPEGFRRSLIEAGAIVKGFKAFRDHHRFSLSELQRIRRRAGGRWIITTEKDIMRLDGFPGFGCCALAVKAQVQEGFYERLRQMINPEAVNQEGA